MIKLFLAILALGPCGELALGAACCGGGFAAPSVIAGDDKAQATATYSLTEIAVDNVDAGGLWRVSADHQQIQTYKLEGARLLSDRWQAGFSLPMVRRSRFGESYSGLGDAAALAGYEYLPDWDYNPYRPKGIGYLQLTMPTGKSRIESDVGGLDVGGSGLWALGLGTFLLKPVGRWDVFASVEAHRSLDRSFSNAQMRATIKPGFGGSLGLGGGYSWGAWRAGGALAWFYEDPIELRGTMSVDGSCERYATGTAAISYLAGDDWAATLSYSDQTIFGDPVNTSLGRTVAAQLQRRWGR
jgi:hypothetical protein